MGEVDRANSLSPVLGFVVDTVAQIFSRYQDPLRDDVGGLQILE